MTYNVLMETLNPTHSLIWKEFAVVHSVVGMYEMSFVRHPV